MPRLNSKQVYVSTEYKVIIYILEAQINLPHRNRRKADFFHFAFPEYFGKIFNQTETKQICLCYISTAKVGSK